MHNRSSYRADKTNVNPSKSPSWNLHHREPRYYISWCGLHDINGDSDVSKLKNKKFPSGYQTASCCITVFHLWGLTFIFPFFTR